MTRDAPAWPRRRGPGPGLTGQSFPRVVAAGTGGPTPDLTAQLFYQLWVLLLHLLSELLAPAGRGGAPGLSLAQGARPTCPSKAGGPLPGGQALQSRSLFLGGRGTRPACPGAPPGRSTHAWMRLARSFCEGLVPGVPRGLWPPEIMPDMLQREPLTHRRLSPPPSEPHLALPLCRQWTSPGAQTCPQPTLLTAACQFHQLSQQHPFLA